MSSSDSDASSTITTASSPSAGPITEDEIRAVFLQEASVTTLDLIAIFRERLRTFEDKKAFSEVLKRISKIQMTNGSKYVVLRDESFPVFFNKVWSSFRSDKKKMSLEGSDSSLTSTASTQSAGPVTEEEIKAFLLQKAPVKTLDLVVHFKARLKTPEAKMDFAEVLRRICKIPKTTNGPNYVVLRDE